MKVLVIQSCLTLWDPMDCSLPGSSVHGILQAGMLEWVAIPSLVLQRQLGPQLLLSTHDCKVLLFKALLYNYLL